MIGAIELILGRKQKQGRAGTGACPYTNLNDYKNGFTSANAINLDSSGGHSLHGMRASSPRA